MTRKDVLTHVHPSIHAALKALEQWFKLAPLKGQKPAAFAAIVNHGDRDRARVRVTLAKRSTLLPLTKPGSTAREALENFKAVGSLLVLTTGGRVELATTLHEMIERAGTPAGEQHGW